MKRTIHTDIIKSEIIKLIYSASFIAPPEIKSAFIRMKAEETNPLASETLKILIENTEIAEKEEIPLCQDCGSTIVFLEIGQELELEGNYLYDAVNDAVAEAYKKFYLRKSIVSDPLRRVNTGTNTPAFIHSDIVPGDRLKIDVLLKGGGSENMSVLRMFRPTDSADLIIDFITESVIKAGPNPCPPLFLGVGIGGTADTAMLNSKKALLRPAGEKHGDPFYAELEDKILRKINATGVGPMGFGGRATAAGVYILTAPTHIASLPVALNMNCHSFRKGEVTL
ncbi:MAG TPA: fumarate hydratase [Spirochaetota bacterium]|nr:fumarate hydratase [Spirochaetota bacterium]HPR36405.1 fumarate hydratase [Spirochaetota bacterium]HRX48005.1 fumarate hydratase [Spirochaetota bacterium]